MSKSNSILSVLINDMYFVLSGKTVSSGSPKKQLSSKTRRAVLLTTKKSTSFSSLESCKVLTHAYLLVPLQGSEGVFPLQEEKCTCEA